ncbi:MAG: hypothetical protein ACR2KZ_02905, partial [Segetibacter sp.]
MPLETREVTYPPFDTPDTIADKDLVSQKDIFDVVGSLFRKKSKENVDSDTSLTKPIFSIVPAVGYSLQTKLAAVVSGNVVFRVSPVAKLSTITASATYTQNKQFFIPILSNISTKKGRYKLIGDFRFYKYPQSTFG